MTHISSLSLYLAIFFFFNDTATTEIYTLSLHDALPIEGALQIPPLDGVEGGLQVEPVLRSEEHTSELQSPCNLVCRLLLEKKKHLNEPPIEHRKKPHNFRRLDTFRKT